MDLLKCDWEKLAGWINGCPTAMENAFLSPFTIPSANENLSKAESQPFVRKTKSAGKKDVKFTLKLERSKRGEY